MARKRFPNQSGLTIWNRLFESTGIKPEGQIGLVFDLVYDKLLSKGRVSFMKVEMAFNLPLLLRRLPRKAQIE